MTHITEAIRNMNEIRVLKKADFGEIRVALDDARLWVSFLLDVLDGKIEIPQAGTSSKMSAVKKSSNDVRKALKGIEMAKKKFG